MVNINISNREITVQVSGNEMIILDRDSGKIHQLNEVAAFIWKLIDNKTNYEDICTAITIKYDVSKETAEMDLNTIINEFISNKLISKS